MTKLNKIPASSLNILKSLPNSGAAIKYRDVLRKSKSPSGTVSSSLNLLRKNGCVKAVKINRVSFYSLTTKGSKVVKGKSLEMKSYAYKSLIYSLAVIGVVAIIIELLNWISQ